MRTLLPPPVSRTTCRSESSVKPCWDQLTPYQSAVGTAGCAAVPQTARQLAGPAACAGEVLMIAAASRAAAVAGVREVRMSGPLTASAIDLSVLNNRSGR